MKKRSLFILSVSLLSLFSLTLPSGAGTLLKKPNFSNAASNVVKVHSARRAHDKLHREGYYYVRHIDTSYDEDDRPMYKFSACKHRTKYRIKLDWYGDILKRSEIGQCHSYQDYSNY